MDNQESEIDEKNELLQDQDVSFLGYGKENM